MPTRRFLYPLLASLLPGLACAADAAPSTPTTATATELASRALYQNVEAFWQQQILSLGGQYRPAPLTLFSQPLKPMCGVKASLVGPFYCPSDETVYLDEDFLPRLGNAAVGYLVAHELAHHVQNTIGTTALVDQARSSSTRAMAARTLATFELQADCYAGLWLRWAEQHGSISAPADLSAVLNQVAASSHRQQAALRAGEQILDPLTHATLAARLKWLQLGRTSDDFNACDTFGAEAAGKL